MKMLRTPEDVRRALDTQISALKASCAGYDAGEIWEAQRLATATYVLLHDGGKRNRSILTQLGVRDSLRYSSTASIPASGNLLSWHPLVMLEVGVAGKYQPLLDKGPPKVSYVSFHQWWERDLIFQGDAREKPRSELSRRRLIFALRNQEGGSHFDEILNDQDYIALSKKPIWFENKNGRERPLMGLESACMRQIAHELLQTLKTASLDEQWVSTPT